MMHLQNGAFLQGGKYRIIRFINNGGFGCTYEAEHVMLEKRVAIKEFFVKDFCNRDAETAHVTVGTQSKKALVDKLRRKFVDEAKALSRMQHPGIVHVSDVFEENGTAYFVMDFIRGRSLAEVVNQDGPLPEARAVRYIREVADALQYVHGHNRLHLDIKPANIMIDDQDHAVLIDFGASKQYDEEDGENTSTLLGKTPGYAPLEQIGNDVVKFMPATDIYALGATLYKLLSGITPLAANLLASGEELEPLPASVSKPVREAIAAAMQINKMERPQTVEAFLNIFDKKIEKDDSTENVMLVRHSENERIYTPNEPVSTNRHVAWLRWAVCYVVVLFQLFWMSTHELPRIDTEEIVLFAGSLMVVNAIGIWGIVSMNTLVGCKWRSWVYLLGLVAVILLIASLLIIWGNVRHIAAYVCCCGIAPGVFSYIFLKYSRLRTVLCWLLLLCTSLYLVLWDF